MTKPIALWLDCLRSMRTAEARFEAARAFSVLDARLDERTQFEIARLHPDVVVFDFDFPDQVNLRTLQFLKRTHPSVPMLMLTVQHSEALAVWAFRARVWNYLVKPVALPELAQNFAAIARVAAERQRAARAVQWPSQEMPREIPVNVRTEESQLLAAVYYVEQRFRERICASEVARMCRMTRFAFSREFHRAFGITFVDFVLRHRIQEACRLLRAPGASITDVSFAVGFNDLSYFGRVFRRYTGMSPSEFLAAKDAAPLQLLADARMRRAKTEVDAVPPRAVAEPIPEPVATAANAPIGAVTATA